MKHITFSEQLQPLHKSRDKNMRHITSHVQMQSNQRRQTNRRYHYHFKWTGFSRERALDKNMDHIILSKHTQWLQYGQHCDPYHTKPD